MYFYKEVKGQFPNADYFEKAFCEILKHIYDNSKINPFALGLRIEVDGSDLVKVQLLNEQKGTFETSTIEIDNNNSMLEEYFNEENLEKYRD